MESFFKGWLKTCIVIGHFIIFGAWAGTGIILYLLPTYYVIKWVGEPNTAPFLILLMLLITGVLSFKWKTFSSLVDLFHVGNSIIAESGTKAVEAVNEQSRFNKDE